MKNLLHIITAFSLLLLPAPSFAEKVWTSFTASDAVYDIAVQGNYIWCATANGPVRWDKRDMSYSVFNSIPDNRTNCLTVDSKGYMWIGTRNGVYRLDPSSGAFTNVTANLPLKDVSKIIAGKDGIVRAIANPFLEPTGPSYGSRSCIYAYGSKNWTEFFADADFGQRAFHIGVDSNGATWFDRGEIYSYSTNKVYRMDARGVTEFTQSDVLPEGGTTGLMVQPDGTVWVGATGKVLRYREGQWTTYALGETAVKAFDIDSHGVVWAVSESGLFRFVNDAWDKDTESSATVLHDINVLRLDASGTKWAGTSSGLYRLENGKWHQYTSRNRLPNGVNPRCLESDSAGNLWTATSNKLMRFNGASWDSISVPADFDASGIVDIKYSHDGIFWIKTKEEILRFDGSVWEKFEKPTELSSVEYIPFVIGLDNSVWLYNEEQCWRLTKDKWIKYDSTKPIQTLTVGYDGVPITGYAIHSAEYTNTLHISTPGTEMAWDETWTKEAWHFNVDFNLGSLLSPAASTFWGMMSYDSSGGGNYIHPMSRIYYLNGNSLTSVGSINGIFGEMTIDPDGSLWVGMQSYTTASEWPSGGGLYQYGFISSYCRVLNIFDAEDGLLTISVESVAVSPDGTVWAGTPYGLTRYGEPLSPIITSVSTESPAPMSILTNHPNPFNPSTTISFTLPAPGRANLTVYDITGRAVRTLLSGRMSAGAHSILWDGRDDSGRTVASGVYLSKLGAENNTAVGRMLLLK